MFEELKLKNPPIKEIIFSVSFNKKIELEKIKDFIYSDYIKSKLPKISEGFNATIEVNQNDRSNLKYSNRIDGYVAQTLKKDKILQLRQGYLSFHKVYGYESFEELQLQLEEILNSLKVLVLDIKISNVAVRYINFIEKTTSETIRDLTTFVVENPFGINSENILSQIKFNYSPNPRIEVTVVVSKVNETKENGILLDNTFNIKLNDEEDISNLFIELKKSKNEIFFKSITLNTYLKYM